jgi:DNA polymerase III sliding clamp (beta) subunit (PCNA family)
VTGRRVDLSADIITELLPAMSRDGSRPILCSVYVGKGTYCTTDSYRLHVVNTSTDLGDTFLIAGPAARVMANYKGTLACTVGEREIRVVLDATTTLTGRLVGGEFPPFRSLIPASPPHRISFTDALAGDLKDVAKLRVGNSDGSPVRITAVGVDELELRRGVTGEKPAVVTTPGTSTLDTVIAFGADYLLDLIAGTTSNTLLVTDRLKPALIREPAPELGDGAERVRLIMPVRVS